MPIVFILVFIGVFALIALPLVVAGSARTSKQVLAIPRFGLSTDAPSTREQILNIRKDSSFSSIPWLNKRLLQFQIAPYLQKLLSQANMKWSASRLLMLMGICFLVPAYGIYFGIPEPADCARHRGCDRTGATQLGVYSSAIAAFSSFRSCCLRRST